MVSYQKPFLEKFLTALVTLIFLALRLDQFLHSQIRVFNDTSGYLDLVRVSIIDPQFWDGLRPFTIPLIFKFFAGNEIWITWFQWAMAVAAWILLGITFTRFLRHGFPQVIAYAGILVLGLLPEVTLWDRTVLSDSLSITLFVIMVAVALWLVRSPRGAISAILAVLCLFWSGARITNNGLLPFIAFALFLAAIACRKRALAVSGLAILLIFGVNIWLSNLGSRWVGPFLHVIEERVLTVPDRTAWFAAHGMPVDEHLVSSLANQGTDLDARVLSTNEFSAFRDWFLSRGESTLIEYLVTHPGFSLLAPFQDRGSMIYADYRHAYAPEGYPSLIPTSLAQTISLKNQGLLLIFLVIGLAGVAAAAFWAPGDLPAWIVPAVMLILVIPEYLVSWNGDGWEVERHVLSAGIHLRLALWMMVFLVMDKAGTYLPKVMAIGARYWITGPVLVLAGGSFAIFGLFADTFHKSSQQGIGMTQWVMFLSGSVVCGYGLYLLGTRKRYPK